MRVLSCDTPPVTTRWATRQHGRQRAIRGPMRCVGGRARTYGRHRSRCSASLAGHRTFPWLAPQQHTRPSAHDLATTAVVVVRSARNPRACCSAHTARDEMLGKRGTHENAVVVLGRARLLAHSASCKEGGGTRTDRPYVPQRPPGTMPSTLTAQHDDPIPPTTPGTRVLYRWRSVLAGYHPS